MTYALNCRTLAANSDILEIAVRDLERRLAAAEVAEHGLGRGEVIYWIQIQNLREIFRRLDDASKMDAFHDILEATLAALFRQNPQLGSFLHITFRDVVIVSDLSENEVRSRVVFPIFEHVAATIGRDLLEIFKRGLMIGSGANFDQAFSAMKLSEFGIDYGIWRREVTYLRQCLVRATETSNTTWGDLLHISRKFGRDSSSETIAKLEEWLHERKVSVPASDVRRYGRLLTMADYYLFPTGIADPMEERAIRSFIELSKNDRKAALAELSVRPSWTNAHVVRQQVASNVGSIQVVIAIDLKGLGTTNRLAQDRWLEQGADIARLGEVSHEAMSRTQLQV